MSASPDPRRESPRLPGGGGSAPSTGEQLWHYGFFFLSAVMAAAALADLSAGRVANGLGDLGICCLMLSLMTQFRFVRAVARAGNTTSPEQARAVLQREAELVRAAHPWAEHVNRTGWALLITSLVLRLLGAA
jgi:hypothetical protein